METLPDLPVGPVADRIAIWPLDSGRYGLDATFQGVSGFTRMEVHERLLKSTNVRFSLIQELNDGWTLRFGPLTAMDVSTALRAFVV